MGLAGVEQAVGGPGRDAEARASFLGGRHIFGCQQRARADHAAFDRRHSRITSSATACAG